MASSSSLVVFVMFLAAAARGQMGTVTGVVIDDRTEQPIRGLLVSVANQPGAETDTNGRFTMVVARGRQTITASVIGYALLQIDVEVGDAPVALTIRLLEGAGAHAERVTVSGSLRARGRFGSGSDIIARARAR
jgi:hypothetical protein